ncbi:hypothetical protein OG742_11380 [Streptomyces sp. NBC_00828]|uniref:hypothetical protein n=1 Tax=Streptomyces sp. NBC_00828 TaxID=2903678 RepID=UPI0038634539
MARRPYHLSPEGRAALLINAEAARKVANSPDGLIARLERQDLTDDHRVRLGALVLRDQPNRDAKPSPETLAELRRLLGGAVR